MKYHKLVENAKKPSGFWGKLMIRSMNKGHGELTDWALCHVTVQPDDVILDVGCGGGKTVDKLCKRISNGKVYGVDYSELCVKKSESLNHKNVICGKARILQASVSELPFEDDKFNLVTAIETYYFWPDKPGDLKEIFRTLAPGGRLMLAFEMVRDSENPDKWKSVEDRLGIKAVDPEELKKRAFVRRLWRDQAFFKRRKGLAVRRCAKGVNYESVDYGRKLGNRQRNRKISCFNGI